MYSGPLVLRLGHPGTVSTVLLLHAARMLGYSCCSSSLPGSISPPAVTTISPPAAGCTCWRWCGRWRAAWPWWRGRGTSHSTPTPSTSPVWRLVRVIVFLVAFCFPRFAFIFADFLLSSTHPHTLDTFDVDTSLPSTFLSFFLHFPLFAHILSIFIRL